MSSTDEFEFRKLNAIIDGDGVEIRDQMILAGLLLMIFERFKEYTLTQVEEFLSLDTLEIKEGKIYYKRAEEFKKLIKQYGKGEKGQHTNEAFRAALKWFHNLDAITDKEFNEIECLYTLRNEISHELYSIIINDRKETIKIKDVFTVLEIYVRVVRWWVKEIEASTDPDFDHENADFDSIESMDTILLKEVVRKVLFGSLNINDVIKSGVNVS